MENSIYIGLSKQVALRNQMNVIANNVANMSTPGYRAQNMVFSEYLNKSPSNPKVPVKDDISQVLDVGHYQNTAAGSMSQTGNPTDVALNGSGYFGIQTNDGVMYTRAGNFQLNVNGELVTGAGNLVADTGGGTITVPDDSTEIRIDSKGVISNQDGELGQLMIVEFENEQELEAEGNGLYRAPEGTVFAEAAQTVAVQGMLEGSNVNPILEMTRMIDVLRTYQSTQKMLQDEHERQQGMLERIGKVS
jgi:flagellar basal-body rod protein FlgF